MGYILKTGKEMILLIESWERIGAKPFQFLPKEFISQYDYKLVEMDSHDPFIDWTTIEGYSSDWKKRVNRKTEPGTERNKYYKIYGNDNPPPVVLDRNGIPLDGRHRLARYRDTGEKFKAYIAIG
jgi:hypothetical protein